MRPVTGTEFAAFYRVGNGTRGNVGADSIAHVAASVIAGIDHVRNPLPATGGVDLETVEDVRRFAPVAFRTQERAVTAEDYATRPSGIRRCSRRRRRSGGRELANRVRHCRSIRQQGSRREVRSRASGTARALPHGGSRPRDRHASFVPVEIAMQVCAKRDYFRADVKRALLDVFSSRILPDGRRGVFHADNFTFGQPIYLSVLYAAAYAVDGVDSVKITVFRRQGTPDPTPLATGVLTFGRLEIARLENSASFPDRGVFRLDVDRWQMMSLSIPRSAI